MHSASSGKLFYESSKNFKEKEIAMTQVTIVYHSGYGHTAKQAQAAQQLAAGRARKVA